MKIWTRLKLTHIESLAEALALNGDCERAARLFGAGEALCETLAASILAFYRADYDRGIRALRSALNEEILAKAWMEGREITMKEAISYALS